MSCIERRSIESVARIMKKKGVLTCESALVILVSEYRDKVMRQQTCTSYFEFEMGENPENNFDYIARRSA